MMLTSALVAAVKEYPVANLAFGRPIEEDIRNPEQATNGVVSGYTGSKGFAFFYWPSTLTLDLGSTCPIKCVRILLWDGRGAGQGVPDPRTYRYRLLTSVDHRAWQVVFDTGHQGYNGWQVFHFDEALDARYIRLHGISNSANNEFHVVQFEVHDDIPTPTSVPTVLERQIRGDAKDLEVGDGLPMAARMRQLIAQIEQLVGANECFNPEPFRRVTSQLRLQVADVEAVERSMESIRREIVGPVKADLAASTRVSQWSLAVGVIGGVLAVIALVQAIFFPT